MASLSTLVPVNYVLTSGVNSVMSWSNVLTLSTANCSTVNASSIVTNSIGANALTVSTLSVSTLTSRTVNVSTITGSSISSNTLTLSLTNASTQNTQIYQVATTNPTTSYTAIQASHVSTGTTNNALVLNPSGGNVGVGTTAPAQMLDITNAASFTPAIRIQNTYSAGYLSMGINAGVNSYIGLQATNTTTSSLTTPPFVVTNTGNGYVGIGTTTPGATLDVNGTIRASTGILISGSNVLEFGHGVSKGSASGRIGYQAFTVGSLDIIGAGLGNDNRNIKLWDNVQVAGTISKAGGTFDITHPLHPDTNKRLVHSFIEGPRCDLIYRGKTTLVDGSAVVNIDKECTHSPECAMEDGTFEALCDNPQVFLQNNKSFDRVRGVVSGATLTITCESQAVVEIEWMVIAERADPFIKQWDRTNPDGYLVTQYGGDASVPTPLSSGEAAAPSE